MNSRQASVITHKHCRNSVLLLVFFSIIGCCLGVLTSHLSDYYSFYMMRMAVSCPVSIVGLTFVTLFPFLITAFAIWISKPILLLTVSFFNSFSFTLIVCYVVSVFGFSGWLVCMMLLFSSAAVQLCLHYLWIRYFRGSSFSAASDLFACICFSFAISMIDYFFVDPYLVRITSF